MSRSPFRPAFQVMTRLFVSVSILALSLLQTAVGWMSPSALTPICKLQGKGFSSPYEGKRVTTRGTVYADQDDGSARGFYMQQENCDTDLATSDGIFVYLGERIDVVSAGDWIEVVGNVDEYYGMTELLVAADDVKVLSSGNSLPQPVELDPPFNYEEARQYHESREAMHVVITRGLTVGPTDNSGRSWVVRESLRIKRVFEDDARGTGEIVCISNDGNYMIDPQVKVGDVIQGLQGALDYEVGEYCLQLFSPAQVFPELEHTISTGTFSNQENLSQDVPFEITLATFNLYNLFDTEDDPATDDTVLSASEYQRRLQKRAMAIHEAMAEPAIIAVQEVENQAVLNDLLLRPELEADYAYVWQDGPDRRGLDVALLYRPSKAQVTGYQSRQGCTRLVDGLGPDGNGDLQHPQNAVTCDTNGDGINDGNRLFSRPPLLVKMQVCQPECFSKNQLGQGYQFQIIANHFKSKVEDSLTQAYTLPRRIEQAEFVASLVKQIYSESPEANVVVLGDLNDTPTSQTLVTLEGSGVRDTILGVPYQDRYTYIFQGISQVLDYILVDTVLPMACTEATPIHINADFPVVFSTVNGSLIRSSDHDPVVVRLKILDYQVFLPVITR